MTWMRRTSTRMRGLLLAVAVALHHAAPTTTTPVLKLPLHPVLVVTCPSSGARVHLVGVSHGSAASAALVRETMARTKPAAVLLELCEERFLSVSLEARLRPRDAPALEAWYDAKLSVSTAAPQSPFPRLNAFEQVFGAIRFASGQGVAGGAFVMLGLLIGSFQRVTRAATGDEFLTAMREADAMRIPVLLVDAAQNETLRSISRVVSPAGLDPLSLIDEARSFAFSALGLRSCLPRKFGPVSASVERASQWLNIPSVYAESSQLGASLVPLLLVGLFPYLFELKDVVDAAAAPPLAETWSLGAAVREAWTHSWVYASLEGAREGLLHSAELSLDALSLLFLVRMSKVIGAERDDLMARNLQRACAQFPGQDLVVVIGMLHCNGIARWLMSGQTPVTEGES